MKTRLHPRRVHLRVLTPVLLLVAAACAPGSIGASAGADEAVGYTPTTSTPAQVAAAQPAQSKLVGISRDYPPICDGVTDAKVDDTGAKTDSDRVDVGAPVIELAGLTPGTTYSYCFFVQNVGKAPISFAIGTTELIGVDDPDHKQELIRPPKSVGTWIHPVATKFRLKPGERQYVPYTIVVPANPPAGTSAGAIEVIRLQDDEALGAGFYLSMLHKVLVTFPGGKNEKLDVTNVHAPRVLTPENGKKNYVLRFNVHNVGNQVDIHHTNLEMKGLGRTITKARSGTSVLLPDGAERVEIRVKNMPWIGFYRPAATVHGRGGNVKLDLPWLFVLPPWPYVVALLLAILLPIGVLLRRWLRSRSEWRAYDHEMDDVDDVDAMDDMAD